MGYSYIEDSNKILINQKLDNNNNTSIINLCQQFNSNNQLQGKCWEVFINLINECSSFYGESNICSEELKNAIITASNSVNSCLDNYNGNISFKSIPVNFNSEFSRIEEEVLRLEIARKRLEDNLWIYEQIDTDSNGKPIYDKKYNDINAAKIAEIDKEIRDWENYHNLINSISAEKRKIEAMFDEIISKISALNSKITS